MRSLQFRLSPFLLNKCSRPYLHPYWHQQKSLLSDPQLIAQEPYIPIAASEAQAAEPWPTPTHDYAAEQIRQKPLNIMSRDL